MIDHEIHQYLKAWPFQEALKIINNFGGFENFKLPYTLSNKDIDNLLNKDNSNDKPPQNMYL